MIDMLRCVAILGLLLTGGCRQAAQPLPSGPASGNGWEVRYNSVLALAHRGSDKFLDPVVQDLVKEMLDEEQQLRNFRATLKSGQEVVDAQAGRTAILGALNAVKDFHAKKPNGDVSGLQPAITKLTQGQNQFLAKEARQLLDTLATPAVK